MVVGGAAAWVVVAGGAACVVVAGGAAWVVAGGAEWVVVAGGRGVVEVVVHVVWVVGDPPPGGVTVRVVIETVSPGAGCWVRLTTVLTGVTGVALVGGGAAGVEACEVRLVGVRVVPVSEDGPVAKC